MKPCTRIFFPKQKLLEFFHKKTPCKVTILTKSENRNDTIFQGLESLDCILIMIYLIIVFDLPNPFMNESNS